VCVSVCLCAYVCACVRVCVRAHVCGAGERARWSGAQERGWDPTDAKRTGGAIAHSWVALHASD